MIMEKKTNCRSIRFSDRIKDLIEAQVGETFTDKFENLVTRCAFELPRKEKEIEILEKRIEMLRRQSQEMSQEIRQLQSTLFELRPKMETLSQGIDRAIARWGKKM